VRVRQGNVDEGVAELMHALRLDPNDHWAHGHLGVAMMLQGKPADAVPHLETALRLKPNDQLARRALESIRGRPPAP
jgi:Flp pilus assembly protein TadD